MQAYWILVLNIFNFFHFQLCFSEFLITLTQIETVYCPFLNLDFLKSYLIHVSFSLHSVVTLIQQLEVWRMVKNITDLIEINGLNTW
jgi:hypothetical protein